MKIVKIGLSLLLVNCLYANDESIIDTTHKKVVKILDDNVEVLPDFTQEKAKSLVIDIDKDGKI